MKRYLEDPDVDATDGTDVDEVAGITVGPGSSGGGNYGSGGGDDPD